jgi:oxaloacetate decarboxylase alpha subunit
MLTNLEGQLKEQNAADKLDAVLEEIPRVREDLGMLPLVTPTSQIVGTQAVINVMSGNRYGTISKETAGILKGEYGATPTAVNSELQKKVLEGADPITVRPADLIAPEVDKQIAEFRELAKAKNIRVADDEIDDVLTFALFPQIGTRFLENRDNPDAFEPQPNPEAAKAPAPATAQDTGVYDVRVNGKSFTVEVAASGQLASVQPAPAGTAAPVASAGSGKAVKAVLAGNIFKVNVAPGEEVAEGQALLIVEAMKMETAVSAPRSGIVTDVFVTAGDIVAVGDPLVAIS